MWKSVKKKLNTNRSTEFEVVGVHDVLSDIMWTKYFLEEQGFDTSINVVYRDSRSALLLELIGRKSKGKRRNHMNNRFFLIKYKVENEGINLRWFPEDQIRADILTKPTQGSHFIINRIFVLGE